MPPFSSNQLAKMCVDIINTVHRQGRWGGGGGSVFATGWQIGAFIYPLTEAFCAFISALWSEPSTKIGKSNIRVVMA